MRIRLYVQLAAESSATRQSRASRRRPTVGQTTVLPARHSAFVLEREEAEQADRPSQTKPGASQEPGCLPDLTAQNNNEKTGQRIHNFEKIVKIKARGSVDYLELV